MDLSRLLNQNEASNARDTSRASSIPHSHVPPPQSSPRAHPPLARQHSLPSYSPRDIPPEYHSHAHSSYAPNVPEYFREGSESLSPRTRPTSIPREASYASIHRSPEITSRPDFAPTSTPARIHTRANSLHSTHSNEPVVQSPGFNHSAAFTPSPVQHFPTQPPPQQQQQQRPILSPLDKPHMPPPQYHQSPVMQQRAMLPPTTPVAQHSPQLMHNSPVIHQSLRQSPPVRRQSPPLQRQSPPAAPAPAPTPVFLPTKSPKITNPTITQSPIMANRKRSLGSVSEAQPPIKRPRVQPPPIWATRFPWTRLQTMDRYVPHAPAKQTAKSRVPSASEIVNGTAPHLASQRPSVQRAWESDLRSSREYSLDNNVPYNELHRTVAQFLSNNILVAVPKEIAVVEVEARLGVLVDPQSRTRYRLPVQSEVILDSDSASRLRFESLMDMVSFDQLICLQI
jgi:hypothetical protein